MAAKRIVLLGDPLLRQRSVPVERIEEAHEVLRDLEDTLAEFRRTHGFGRGISAVQIGVPVRVIFMEVGGVRYELVNPEYVWRSEEKFHLWDDCFSFPNLMVWLERSRRVKIQAQNANGDWYETEAFDDLAELIQHEMDHLDGVLAIDHAAGPDCLAMREKVLERKSSQPTEKSPLWGLVKESGSR